MPGCCYCRRGDRQDKSPGRLQAECRDRLSAVSCKARCWQRVVEMGLPLLIIGLLMVITGGRGTYAQFGSQVASEFQGGKGSFTYWILAIGAIGAVGYVPQLQTVSRWMLTLVIVSLFLSHKGFFAQFQAALAAGPTAPNAVPQSSGFSIPVAISWATGAQGGNPPTAQAAQSTGAGTVNTWLQGLPGIGSWFTPPAAGSAAPAF
jgi:hypothetical protein